MSKPKLSLASLSVNAPSPTTAPDPAQASAHTKKDIKTSKHQDIKMPEKVQVAFRMSPDAHKELRRMAIDEGTTVNDLLLQGINVLRANKGLRPFDE